MNDLPIGLFDSGVGGLTVLKAVREHLPAENTLYLGDTARLPYGSKSPETIIRYAVQASAKLVDMRVKMLVVACNTVSAVALPTLAQIFPHIPVVGVVEPGAEAACAASTQGRIVVIATESTIRGEAYTTAILRRRPDADVRPKACPLFVALAEEGLFDGPIVEGIVSHYLAPLFQTSSPPDCVVLGCTHYPLLASAIAVVIGKLTEQHTVLVDSAATTARVVGKILAEHGLARATGHDGTTTFCTTDDPARFARVGSLFLGETVSPAAVRLVDL